MCAFFVAYFLLLRHPLFPAVTVPLTTLDAWIGFHPLALLPYVALWPYVALLPALLIDRRELLGFALGCAGLSVAGLAIFLLWPSIVPTPAIDWARHPAIAFLKTTDAAGNACPSLHAAFAVFTGLWFARLLPRLGAGPRLQLANLLCAALIVYSTLGTKQHVALDALFGSALGAFAAGLDFILTPPGEDAPARRLPLFATVAVLKLSALGLWLSGQPLAVCLPLFFAGGAFVLFELFAPNQQGLARVRTRFVPSAPDAREVWLTIDDGPDPDDTPRILDLLDQHRARATFFLVGERVARHPLLVSEIQRRGHELAHHTLTHPAGSFWLLSRARLARELAPTGFPAPPPTRFRPPVGFKNLHLAPALAARGLACVGWTIRSRDTFATDPATVAARVRRRLRPGVIVLLHEGPPLAPAVRVHALALVLRDLTAAGYRAVIPAPARLR